MVLPDSHKIPLTSWYLGAHSNESFCFRLQDFHPLWLTFPGYSTNNMISYSPTYLQFSLIESRYTINTTVAPLYMLIGFGSFPFARHYSENRFYFLFLRVLRCFSSPGWLPAAYVFSCRCYDITRNRLSHSDTCGS